ncbi:hypothetical protein DFH27DRAFT_590044 [Peziza echinospora]|nr:hypothetical protein DFH27DRAFT_590044 [Peziza echinospora]
MAPPTADTGNLISQDAKTVLAGRKLTEQDRQQLLTPDSEFTRLSWPTLRTIVADNRLELLRRVPSDLARYIIWLDSIRKQYPEGGVMEFILKDKLGWYTRGEEGGRPKADRKGVFESKDDVSILRNDWPYGLATDPPIVHLVVWLKTPVPVNPEDGDLTAASRALIDGFVEQVFGSVVGKENVLWFKNWASLQSVPSVEHFHVLVQGPTEEQVREWVEGPWGGKKNMKTLL